MISLFGKGQIVGNSISSEHHNEDNNKSLSNETTSRETKSGETKLGETKSGETTSGETKSKETTSGETKSKETKYDINKLVSSKTKQTRVMFCGTYPIGQSNGYSRVVYYIAKHLGGYSDIKLTIYGFQNMGQTAGSEQRSDIPSSVILHDAMATEDPKRNGFGEKEIADYIKKNPQDIIVIFNDMVVTASLVSTMINELSETERKAFKLVSYMDQVYPYQKPMYIDLLNKHFDAIITFTPYWKNTAQKLGLKKEIPCYVFPHGFDYNLYYPINKIVARVFYSIPDDAFVILQLNRNPPRKRLDHTLIAYAQVVKRYYDLVQEYNINKINKPREIKLMIAAQIEGFWNLIEVYDHELKLLEVPIEFGRSCLIALARPQQMSDRDINILYNACDIGLNTCEGEGFGLCQFEHAAIGYPQVAPKIGGIQEFLNETNSILIEPKMRYYIDKQRDGIGGIAELGLTEDYTEAIWKYYKNPSLVIKHGTKARKDILQHYKWETVVKLFHKILLEV